MIWQSILITIIFLLVFYFIISGQVQKIKKDYVKTNLTDEMRDIIAVFTSEADRNITVLQELIAEAEEKIKRLEELSNNENVRPFDNNNKDITLESSSEQTDDVFNKVKSNESVDKRVENVDNLKIEVAETSFEIDEEQPEGFWEERAFRLYENGFSEEEIALKTGKSIGEIQFVLKFLKLKKRIR